jgi:glycerol-3-phosphate acyltransferase PlsY
MPLNTFTVLYLPPLLAYFLGSIPFGLILTKVFTKKDIRSIGSGNIGATNVLRAGGKKLAAITLLLDALKGVIVIVFIFGIPDFIPSTNKLFAYNFEFTSAAWLGLFAILGHCFPIWLKFKGGKGVATALGVLLAAVPYAGLSSCATWLLMAFIFKYSSLAALAAVAVAPVVTLFVYGSAPAGVCALIALLVWVRHAANIKRLLNGTEPKIGAKKAEAATHREDAKTPSGL